MTALIIFGSIVAYIGVGLLMITTIARWRYEKHRNRYSCLSDNCNRYDSEEEHRECSATWASFAWILWPYAALLGFPRIIAAMSLQKDADELNRVKQLEEDAKIHAVEQDKATIRARAEEVIRRENDVRTMSVETFGRLMEKEIEKSRYATL